MTEPTGVADERARPCGEVPRASPSADAPTIGRALAQARARGLGRLDAQWLLGGLLDRPPAWLLAHDDEALAPALAARWVDALARRAGGEPLAYVLGRTRFCGLPLAVGPAVLIPRPETEDLVRWGDERLAAFGDGSGGRHRPRVADLGTGSGAVALAVASRWPAAEVWAVDCSADALAVARANARALGLAVAFAQGSWWQPLAGRRFDLVLANPPYVAAGDPHLAALAHEPLQALTPGGDGLDALRAIVAGAPAALAPGGWLLLEHGHDQGEAVRSLLLWHGFTDIATRTDLAGLPRCSGGRHGRGGSAAPAP